MRTCSYCKTDTEANPCSNCGAPASHPSTEPNPWNLSRYDGPATHLPKGFHSQESARKMAEDMAALRCPLEDCTKPLDTSAPQMWHAQCSDGHIFRKEDLYYLRHLEPVA